MSFSIPLNAESKITRAQVIAAIPIIAMRVIIVITFRFFCERKYLYAI